LGKRWRERSCGSFVEKRGVGKDKKATGGLKRGETRKNKDAPVEKHSKGERGQGGGGRKAEGKKKGGTGWRTLPRGNLT